MTTRAESVTTLDNGLRLVHLQHPGALAAIYVWFDVGTVDESPEEAGAAHLLEHMLFKGTERRGVGACAAEIEGMGGDLNAYTTWDQTVFHATVLAQHWQQALDVLADMVWHSAIDPEELAREKPVVLEEIRGYDDDPDSVVDDTTQARLFPGHPYGRPVLGTARSVSAIDREALVAFWRRHYTTNRCILGVVGPMDHAAVRAAVEQLTRTAPAGPARAPVPPIPPREQGVLRVDRPFETPLVSLAWDLPGGSHPDWAAWEVLANALGSGRASLLVRQLRIEQRVVADVYCSAYARRTAGSLEVGVFPMPGKTPDAVAGALAVIQDAGRGGLSANEVDRARTTLLAELVFSTETVDSLAHDRVWYTGRFGSPDAREAWRAAVSAVTASDVQRLARSLGDPTITWIAENADPKAQPPSVHTPTARTTPRDLDVDIRFSGPDDGWPSQGPIASIYLAVPGGRLAQPEGYAGLSGMWASTVTTGAGSYDNAAFAGKLDALSASLSAISGRNTLGLQLTVPVENLRPAAELLRLVVLEPRFDATECDRIAGEIRFDLDTLVDRPDEVASRTLWKQAWKGHPWGALVTRTSLRRIRPRTLQTFHRSWFTRHGLKIAVAGEVDRATVLSALHPLVEALPAGVPLPERPDPAPWTASMHRPRAGHEAAIVTLAARTPPLHHPTVPALRLASAALGAQSGPLFMNLRETASLAYSVWARDWEGFDGGLFALGLSTDPQRATAARKALLAELERIATDGIPDHELVRHKTMVKGQLAMSHQRAAGRAISLGLAAMYDRPVGLEALSAEVDAIDGRALREAVASLPEPLSVVVRPLQSGSTDS